jgi:hypothetical protein
VRAVDRPDQLVQLELNRSAVAVLLFWMRKTMRKVTIVVAVLITSCQVLLKRKRGPLTSQTPMRTAAAAKVAG